MKSRFWPPEQCSWVTKTGLKYLQNMWLLNKIYLFGRQSERERDLLSVASLPTWLSLGTRSLDSHPGVFHMSSGGPITWAIFSCVSRCFSEKLDQKQKHWDLNQYSDTGCKCCKQRVTVLPHKVSPQRTRLNFWQGRWMLLCFRFFFSLSRLTF